MHTPSSNIPHLLLPQVSTIDLLTAPYTQTLLDRMTAALRDKSDEFDFPHEINLSFLSLCNHNLIHLVCPNDFQQVHMWLQNMTGEALVGLARKVQLGIQDFLARPGTSQQRPNATVGSSGGQSTGETPRSQAQARRALDRDSSTCVLSGENSPYNEVAYIFPYSVGRFFSSSPESGPTNLHTFLSLFAGSTIISMLESYLLSPVRSRSGAYWTRINRLENLFTLTPTLHRMWDDCVFTLIPIGDPLAGISDCSEFTSYSVTFQWLPKHRHPQLDLTQVSNPGQHMGEEEDSTVSGPFVFNHRTNTRLVSGTVIRLHTSDPISHPLPHPDLLRLHAAIARVVRCAGASGEKQGDDYCGEDEEEWEEPALKIDSFGEEEVEQPEDLELVETQLPTPWVLRHHTSNAKPISFALRRFMQGD